METAAFPETLFVRQTDDETCYLAEPDVEGLQVKTDDLVGVYLLESVKSVKIATTLENRSIKKGGK